MPRDPNNPRWGFQVVPMKDRFMAKVQTDDNGCWLWTGTITRRMGYGRFGVEPNRSDWAHRASWILFRGPIPEGREIDHLCRVTRCVNPDHLEAVTHKVNVRRSFEARYGGRCASGLHELTDENRIIGRDGSRLGCRLCYNARQREGRLRRSGVALYEGSSPNLDNLTSSGAQE